MNQVYWRSAYVFQSADPVKVNKELNRIKQKTPNNVVDYAQNEKAEMHKCFDWDDTEAAQKYRLWQARNMINCLIVNYSVVNGGGNTQDVQVNVFSSVSTDDGRMYVRTADALNNDLLRAQVIQEVTNMLGQAQTKMIAYEMFFEPKHRKGIERILEEITA